MLRHLILIALCLSACGGPKPAPVVPPTEAPANASQAIAPRAIETPALLASPIVGDPANVTIHRLSNGMTVYLSPDGQEPSVSAQIVVRAGSRHDPKLSTGLAHYLEHMLFKGTPQLGTLDYAKEKTHLDRIAALYGALRQPNADRAKILAEIDSETQKSAAFAIPNELDHLYARLGITGLNAYTEEDATVYITEVPKNRLAQWARVEASRYGDAVFRLFWPELEAVYEEKNRSLDNPAWRIEEALMKTLFPDHGYGWSSGIGEIEHLKNPAYADMQAYFDRFYSPGNMAIVLNGDVDASVLPILEQEFGKLRRPAGAAIEPGQITPLLQRTQIDVTVPSNEGVVLGWHLVAATHPDRYALEVMDLLLLDGTSGMITRDLLLPHKVATAGSNPSFQREAGWFQLHANMLAGQSHEAIEELLLGLVGKLQRGEFTDTDLATAVLHYDIHAQRDLESNGSRAELVLSSFVDGRPWSEIVNRLAKLRAVTKEDVMRVANRYLGKNYVAVRKVKGDSALPKIVKPPITAVPVDSSRQSAFAKEILAMTVEPIAAVSLREGVDYHRAALATGPIITVTNRRNGLFSVHHEFELGRSDDRLLCLALEVWKAAGAGKRNPEQLARYLHELGVSVDTSCDRSTSSITLSGVDKNLDAGVAILHEWLADPVFDESIVRATVVAAMTQRANLKSSPQGIAAAAQQFALFGKHSEFLVQATDAQLGAARPAQLKAILARLLTLQHRTAYFGPRAVPEAGQMVALGTGRTAARPPRPRKFRPANAVFVVDQPTAQTHVWMIWPKPLPANDHERAAGMVFSSYAQALLYQEIREARGLAYSVFGAFDPGARKIDDASLLAYAGTQVDKTHDVLEAITTMLRKPIDEHRLATARETILETHRIERIPPRARAQAVYAWEDQGEKLDPRATRVARAMKLSKDELARWLSQVLARRPIISITGALSALHEAKLRKLAPVTVVAKQQLFGF